jgi:thiol-disulfide isomerase/thioredoxin
MNEERVAFSYKTILFLVVVVLAVAAVVYWNVSSHRVSEETRDIFTNTEETATYIDIEGRPLSLDDYLGEVIVVVSWASWSPFSEADLSSLSMLANSYGEAKVTFIGLNRKETKEQAARYLATIPALTEVVIAIDTEDRFYQFVGGYAMPETVIFNESGEIVFHARGVVPSADIKAVVDQELAS